LLVEIGTTYSLWLVIAVDADEFAWSQIERLHQKATTGPFATILANIVSNGHGSLDALVTALEQKGLIRGSPSRT